MGDEEKMPRLLQRAGERVNWSGMRGGAEGKFNQNAFGFTGEVGYTYNTHF